MLDTGGASVGSEALSQRAIRVLDPTALSSNSSGSGQDIRSMSLAPGGFEIPSGDTKPKLLLVGKRVGTKSFARGEEEAPIRICVVGFPS